jgi:hypothetical protein
MADPERSLPLATVIWFGSLEFMSLGHGYDMVLLPPRHPTDGDHELSQPGGALRRYRCSRQARAARRRQAQRNRRHRLAEGDGIPRSSASQLDADRESHRSAARRNATTTQFDYTGTRNDAFVSIPVWTRPSCLGVCFFYKHEHECLRGTPWTPSTLHPRPCCIHTSFRVPGLHGDPRDGVPCNYFLTS